jgi:hypothetical protein
MAAVVSSGWNAVASIESSWAAATTSPALGCLSLAIGLAPPQTLTIAAPL